MPSDPKALPSVATVAGVVDVRLPLQESTAYIEIVLPPSFNT
jgi:hypothetical protein